MSERDYTTVPQCPECDAILELADYGEELVTYWGDQGPVRIECGSCGAQLEAEENVLRSWSIAATRL